MKDAKQLNIEKDAAFTTIKLLAFVVLHVLSIIIIFKGFGTWYLESFTSLSTKAAIFLPFMVLIFYVAFLFGISLGFDTIQLRNKQES